MRSRSSSQESCHSPVPPSYKRKPIKSPITVNFAHINQLVRKSREIEVRNQVKIQRNAGFLSGNKRKARC